jgi:hypothetical protein
MDCLPPLFRAIYDGCDLDVALVRIGELAANPPSDWGRSEWLIIVAAANARALLDPHWFKVQALAYETGTSDSDATSGLWARAHILISLGVDETDSFRRLSYFVERAEKFLGSDTPDAALESYRRARSTIFTHEQSTPTWLEARDRFLRCRRLRDFGKIADALIDAGHILPVQLACWASWKDVREEDFAVGD